MATNNSCNYSPTQYDTQVGGASGVLANVSPGTSGYVLTSNGASAAPTFQAATGGITTIDGNSGSVTGSTVTIDTSNSNIVFNGSSATLTLNMAGDASHNILVGTAGSITSGSANTSLGYEAGQDITSATNNTSIGSYSMSGEAVTGSNNTAVGYQAGQYISSGAANTSIGSSSMNGEAVTGANNTAVGYQAGQYISSGAANTAIGLASMSLGNISGSNNTAIGANSLKNINSDVGCVAVGYNAGLSLQASGGNNVLVGYQCATSLATGAYNVIVGEGSGSNYTTSESSNILINSSGTVSESNVLRIGAATGSGTRDIAASYICGIDGVALTTANIVTEVSNQLGTAVLTAGTNITIDATSTPNQIIINGSGGGSGVSTLTANSGGALSPSAGNFDILGDTTTIEITGSSSTLTAACTGIVATSFTTDDFNVANPSSNYLIIAGANGIITSSSGNTVTITNPSSVFTTVDGDSGSVTGSTISLYASNTNTSSTGPTVALGAMSGTAMGLSFIDTNQNMIFSPNGPASATGSSNTGFGVNAFCGSGASAPYGSYNCAFGYQSLYNSNTSIGDNNVAIGYKSGQSYGGNAEANNILINSNGVNAESNVLRIGSGTGTGAQQLNSAYIAGINGITVTGTAVLVSTDDQLGIAVSSRKYKDNIQDMGAASEDLYKLRPTTFTYKGSEETRFGLIAEEVAQVYPNLVVYDKQGDPQTVMYHELPALLLNEIQKLRKELDELKGKLNV